MKKLIKKGTKLYSIFNFKCPHCHEGEFFKSRNPYNPRSMSETNKKCSVCQRKLSLEPGFYYGAMYVSYSFGVAHIIAFWLAKTILDIEVEFWNFIIVVGIALFAVTPFYYALSKIIWANLFMNYKRESKNEKP